MFHLTSFLYPTELSHDNSFLLLILFIISTTRLLYVTCGPVSDSGVTPLHVTPAVSSRCSLAAPTSAALRHAASVWQFLRCPNACPSQPTAHPPSPTSLWKARCFTPWAAPFLSCQQSHLPLLPWPVGRDSLVCHREDPHSEWGSWDALQPNVERLHEWQAPNRIPSEPPTPSPALTFT